jgi:hypothetical protein
MQLVTPPSKPPHAHAPRGQGLVEYGFILALVALAAIIAVTLFGETIQDTFADLMDNGEYAPPDIGPIGGQFTQRPPTFTPTSTPTPLPSPTTAGEPSPTASNTPPASPTASLTPSLTPSPTPSLTPPCAYGPYTVPGRVEMENFFCGGQGVAYNDTTAANQGGAYRVDEGVDIENRTGGGFHVGFNEVGEWLTYKINVTQTGVYRFDLRFASTDANGQFNLYIDDMVTPLPLTTAQRSLSNTGGWQTWQTHSIYAVGLAAGQRTVKFQVTRRTMNLDYFEFTLDSTTPTPTPSVTPIPSATPTIVPSILYVANVPVNPADLAIITRLQNQGYAVQLMDDGVAQTSDATGKILVIISSTVDQGVVSNKFRTVTVPVLTWEYGIYNTMRMSASGNDASNNHSQLDMVATNSTHPLAAGLSGTVTINTQNTDITRGAGNANAIVIATFWNNPSRHAIFAYPQGAMMNESFVAPARRVGFFFADSTAEFANANSWALFDAAVTWAITGN